MKPGRKQQAAPVVNRGFPSNTALRVPAVNITVEIKFWEKYLPPRCRKVRSRENKAMVTAELREVTREQAPVAIIQTPPRKKWGRVVEYRWFEQKLYTRSRKQYRAGDAFNGKWKSRWKKPSDLRQYDYHTYDSVEVAQQKWQEGVSEYLLIDGELWKEAGEPVYVVMTFGLGGNHGLGWGTSISVDNYYNSNISHTRYYRIDQEEKANAAGLKIALGRGDTKAKPHFTKRLYERFEILIPDAVRAQPAKEHGDGCPFINKLNAVTDAAGGNATVAAFGVLAALKG